MGLYFWQQGSDLIFFCEIITMLPLKRLAFVCLFAFSTASCVTANYSKTLVTPDYQSNPEIVVVASSLIVGSGYTIGAGTLNPNLLYLRMEEALDACGVKTNFASKWLVIPRDTNKDSEPYTDEAAIAHAQEFEHDGVIIIEEFLDNYGGMPEFHKIYYKVRYYDAEMKKVVWRSEVTLVSPQGNVATKRTEALYQSILSELAKDGILPNCAPVSS